MKSKRFISRFLPVGALSVALTLAIFPNADAQTTYVWDGGADHSGTALGTAANWNPDGVPTSSTLFGDTVQWDGTAPGNLFLTYNATFGGSPTDRGLAVELLPGQTGNVTIDNNDPSVARSFRVTNITVNSVGGLAFGNGSGSTITMTLQAAGGTMHTFTNNSANPLIFHSETVINSSVSQSLIFDGSGNSVVNGTITTAASTLTKNGTGTLTIAGSATYTGMTTVNAGTLVVGNGTSGSLRASVSVAGGTLMGSLAAGDNFLAATIGTGSGPAGSSIISAGTGENSTGRLSISRTLTLASDSNFIFDLDSTAGMGDQVLVANGTTIKPGALFAFNFYGSGEGLSLNQTFTVIGGAGVLSGSEFSNLVAGQVFDFGNYQFEANDYLVDGYLAFTVTAVPEPSTSLLIGSCIGLILLSIRRKTLSV